MHMANLFDSVESVELESSLTEPTTLRIITGSTWLKYY